MLPIYLYFTLSIKFKRYTLFYDNYVSDCFAPAISSNMIA
jgi:hypothetical protein